MNIIAKLFNKKNEPLYNFQTINFNEIKRNTDFIEQLRNESVDGFLIKNVFDKDEVKKLIDFYNATDESHKIKIDSGLTIFPEPFSKIDQESGNLKENLKKHYIKAKEFWARFPLESNVDFPSRIANILTSFNSGIVVDILKGINDDGIYNPATFKEMSSDGGELKAHCGNFFKVEFGTFYSHLEEKSHVTDQLSYFIMLQLPEEGGELTLYNLRWKNVKKRLKGNTVLEDDNGKKYDLLNEKQVKRQKIRPEPGDMILFSGGQVWHKVEFIKGNINRLTIGGFVSFKRDSKGLYFWS